MTDRLPSNPQSHLPNYGQGQQDDKNKDVDKKKDGATGQSGKNAGQGTSEKNKAEPQMKSKERKEKAPSESDSDHGGKAPDTFGKLFLGKGASAAARKFGDSDESSSEDGAAQSKSNTLKSPRQQQPDKKEKTTNNKAPKAFLKNFGDAIARMSGPREMAISPRETKGETPRNTHRNTQDSNSSISNTAESGGTTNTTNTLNATVSDRTTKIVEVPLWQPASPRSEWDATSQANLPASAKSTETTKTSTATTTSNTNTTTTTTNTNIKKNLATTVHEGGEKKISKVPENKASATSGKVNASLLPSDVRQTIYSLLSGHIVSGDQLAKLLVSIESKGYTEPLETTRVDKILRAGMTVEGLDDPESSDKKLEVNIIELVLKALKKDFFNVGDIEKFTDQIAIEYKKIAKNLTQKMKETVVRELRKNKEFVSLMKPLAVRFIENFFGKELKLSGSGFSPEFNNLLQGIDKYIVEWAKATGNVQPDVLLNARKSSIAAFTGTRGITIIMQTQLLKDANFKAERLDLLSAYLNTVMTTQTDDFYFDIMSNSENQDEAQKKLINAHKKGSALNQREKSLESRREKISSLAVSDVPISPREKIKSPRKETIEKKSEILVANRQNIRNEAIKKFQKQSKIKNIDPDFSRHFRESLWTVDRTQYQQFKDNPAENMLRALEKYMKDHSSKINSGNKLLLPMKAELQLLVDQKNKASLAAEAASTSLPVVSATETLNTEDVAERSSDDSSAASENAVSEESAKSPSDEFVAEPPTAEKATPNVPGDSSAASEKISQQGLRDSPSDDSESSSSQ